jgi:hypothetical protein
MLDPSEVRIQELVQQIAQESDSAKIVVLARELTGLLAARNARLASDSKATPK